MADVISKIKILEELARLGGDDEVLVLAIDKLTRYKRDMLERDVQEIDLMLKKFEDEYDMESEDFVLKFKKGEAGDSMDFLEWASLYDMRNRITKRITILEGKE